MFYSIKQIMPNVLDINQNWRLILLKNWSIIVGNLNQHIRLEKIQDDTLVIGVYEPQWLQELHLMSNVLIKSINKNLANNYIKKIKFKLVEKKIAIKQVNTNNSENNFNISLKYQLNSKQEIALEKIGDLQLKNYLLDFLSICNLRNTKINLLN